MDLSAPHLSGIAVIFTDPDIFSKIINFLSLPELLHLDLSFITNDQLRPIYLSSLSIFTPSASPSVSSLSLATLYHPLNQLPDSLLHWVSSRQIPLTSVSIMPSSPSRPVNLSNIFSSHDLLQHLHSLKFISPSGFSSPPNQEFLLDSSLTSLDFSESTDLLDENFISIFQHKKPPSTPSQLSTSAPPSFPHPNLQSLNLNNQSQLTSKSLKAILKSQGHSGNLPSLTNLQLKSCHGIDNPSLKSFLSSKLCKQKLQTLNLQNCSQIFPNTFREISSQLSDSLTSLNLSSCSSLCDRSLHKILLKCKSLQFLNLSATLISVTAFSNLPKSPQPLELLVDHCSLMNSSCVGIISCIYRKLKRISLMNTPIDHAAVISLSQCSDLNDISLTLSSPTNAIPYLLCKCHHLHAISLTGSYSYLLNTTPSSPIIQQEYLLPSLCPRLAQYGQHITHLSFTQVHFTPDDYRILSSSSSCCPLLSSLTLHSCFSPPSPSPSSSFQSEEWKELIRFLISAPSLTHLSLSPCEHWPPNSLSQILRARDQDSNSREKRGWVSLSLRSTSSTQFLPPLTTQDLAAFSSCRSLETLHLTQLSKEEALSLRRVLSPLPRLSSLLL
jgi:hypothetical protein